MSSPPVSGSVRATGIALGAMCAMVGAFIIWSGRSRSGLARWAWACRGAGYAFVGAAVLLNALGQRVLFAIAVGLGLASLLVVSPILTFSARSRRRTENPPPR